MQDTEKQKKERKKPQQTKQTKKEKKQKTSTKQKQITKNPNLCVKLFYYLGNWT